jgi:hypothetical protein
MQAVVCALVAFVIVVPAIVAAQVRPPPPPPPPEGVMPRDAQAAPDKKGTARLAGRVLDAENGRPLRRAVVRAMSPELREGRSVSTDADGRWEMRELPAGRYSLMISKGGFVALQHGQRRPFEQGKPVELADGQTLDKLDVSLPKGSVITGRILDEFGEPVAGARVAAMRHRFLQGQRRLVPSGGGMGMMGDVTDDLGQYRLHGLAPGEYYVSASISAGFTLDVSADRTGYAATYYPGTASATEAQRVSVTQGQETSEISFALTPTRVASISGSVTTSSGRPVANEMIMLAPGSLAAFFGPLPGMGRTRADGSFTISNVPAGEYRLETRVLVDTDGGATMTAGPAETASVPITVAGRDLSGIAIVTAPTGMATGRVVFEGGVPPGLTAGAVTVFGVPEHPTMSFGGGQARVREDWTFEAKGLSGRRFIRVMGPPAGWAMKTITLNGQDVTDSAIDFKSGESVSDLEITLTQRLPRISGTVHGDRNAPAGDYVVVAFSPDSRKWGHQTRYVRTARPDQSGTFVMKDMPADDYLLVALEYLEPGEEGDPELLERLRRGATPVTLSEAESKTVTLKLSRER